MSHTDIDSSSLLQLKTLRRQYLQLVEPAQLRWPDAQTLKAPQVQIWIFHNFFDLDHVSHPPPDRYQLRVLKLLVSKLESAIDDPEEDVWFLSSSFLSRFRHHLDEYSKVFLSTIFSRRCFLSHYVSSMFLLAVPTY